MFFFVSAKVGCAALLTSVRLESNNWMGVHVSLQAAATALAAPFVAAASAPAPSAAQILAAFTDAIPEVEAPSATVKVADFQGRPAASFKLPTADTIFSALEKLGRRHLLQDSAAPAPAPQAGPQGGPGFPALPQPAAVADSSSGDAASDGAWYQTNEGNIPPGGAQPQPLPLPQVGGVQTLAPSALPGQAQSAGAPQPELIAPGPAIAFGPIPSEVKVNSTSPQCSTYTLSPVLFIDKMGRELAHTGCDQHYK